MRKKLKSIVVILTCMTLLLDIPAASIHAEENPEAVQEESVYEDDLSEAGTDVIAADKEEPADESEQDTDEKQDDFQETQQDEADYFTVSYVSEESGATGMPVDDKEYESGDLFTVSSQIPELEGYRLAGWSLTGDPADIYTGGYQFSIAEDMTLTAIWEADSQDYEEYEGEYEDIFYNLSEREQAIVNAVNSYVNSLNGKFPYDYYVNGVWKSNTCCAFADYVWKGVFGHSRREKPGMCSIYNSEGKLGGQGIYQFLRDNGAGPGDIIWCHDPYSANNFSITHYMVLLGYDANTVTLSDGRGVNHEGVVWGNNITIGWNDPARNKYFNGNCYVRLYHLKGDEIPVDSPVAPDPIEPTPVPGADYSGKCGPNLIWSLKKDGYYYGLTISGTGPMDDYDSYMSTPWYLKLYEINANCNSIVLNEGITKISAYAFDNMGSADTIVIPSTVTEIGEEAFRYYHAENLVIPDSVRKLGSRAFAEGNMKTVTLGKGLTEIPDWCFNNCIYLAGNIAIPEGVTRIGERAFALYPGEGVEIPERTVTLPQSLKEIGSYVFLNNINLKSVTPLFPDGLERVGEYAFQNCSSMSGTLTLHDELILGIGSFKNCRSLTGKLTVPGTIWAGTDMHYVGGKNDGLTEHWRIIPNYCFYGCSGFTGLELMDGIDEIGDCAFYGCSSISGELKFPQCVNIGEEAFKNCSSLSSIVFPHRKAKSEVPAYYYIGLHDGAFEGCSGLTGTLTLNANDLTMYNKKRTFYGTNYSAIRFEGFWGYDFFGQDGYFASKGSLGFYHSYGDGTDDYYPELDYENVPIDVFPENAVMYYDDGFVNRWNYTDEKERAKDSLEEFGYEYKFYSEAGIESPYLSIVDPNAPDLVVKLGGNASSSFTPYNPFGVYPEEMNRIEIDVADKSVAEIEHTISEYNGFHRYLIKPNKIGQTTYTVRINTKDFGLQTETGTIRVVANDKAVTGVNLDRGDETIEKGDSFQVRAIISPENAANKAVTWSSDNTGAATVSSSGKVTGVGRGKARITATTKEGGYTASLTVTVTSDGYTVAFDGNGATDGAMTSLDCDFNKKYTLPKNTYVFDGFVFDGWSTVSDDDEGGGLRLADKASFTNLVAAPTEDDADFEYGITLYAQWRPDRSYTIVYDANSKKAYGATVKGAMSSYEGLAYSDAVPVYNNRFRADGCEFLGWNTKADGTGRMIDNAALASNAGFSLKDDLGVAELSKAGTAKVTLYAQWGPQNYTATFDADGGAINNKSFGTKQLGTDEGLNENQASFVFGTAIRKLPDATKNGYAFGGWYEEGSTGTIVKSIPKNRIGDITLKAKWIPWKFTVAYDPNKKQGGQNYSVSGRTAKTAALFGEPLTLSNNGYINKGYKLVGWSTTEGASAADPNLTLEAIGEDGTIEWNDVLEIDGFNLTKNSDSVKLYAIWNNTQYNVHFELNGGSAKAGDEEKYADRKYDFGTGLPDGLPSPVREGYVFEGWFANPAFMKAVKKVDDKSFGDMTLYAKWSASYQVILHNDGAQSNPYTGFVFNKEKAIPANPYKNDKKAFIGWATENGGPVIYADKAKLKDPVLHKNGTVLTLDLFAVWDDEITVTIDMDGGQYTANEKNKAVSGAYSYETISKTPLTLSNTLIKDGYKFTGWFDTGNGKKITKITKKEFWDHNIKAGWTPLTYQITYNANMPKGAKGGGKMSAQKLTYGLDVAKLNANDFFANGYEFAGWSRDPKALQAELADGAVFAFGEAGFSAKVTLYAVWALEQ